MIGFTPDAAPVGAVFGAIIVGRLADIRGRKIMRILNYRRILGGGLQGSS
ncbi:TPA: hypothetical protein ACPSKE_000480 [Legionella feeleii]